MSKILKVYHPEGKVCSKVIRKLIKEIKTVTDYSDKIEVQFKNHEIIKLRKD